VRFAAATGRPAEHPLYPVGVAAKVGSLTGSAVGKLKADIQCCDRCERKEEQFMLRPRILMALIVCLFLTAPVLAQPLPLLTAHGTVDKADKESLTLRPRDAEGKFGKSLTLKLTGTSKITTLTTQMRAGKRVMVQRDTEVADLQPKQLIAVIYTTGKDGSILLTAVVQPASEK
jgi:hypothetical protein